VSLVFEDGFSRTQLNRSGELRVISDFRMQIEWQIAL